ncbi:nitroreductase family protein [Fusobacterium nucleatum]|uniref:nitroreductase family protein n=1 Tax=Fusobacterium TaxID=848 RepID=UPI0025DD4888|nr:nitroreductase family protein [uncultured Fusobacterium sp.]
MELLKLISDRYSCRRYSQEVVKDEDILKILEAGRIAPTAHNNQPQRIYVVKSEEGKEKLMKDFKFNFKAPCYLVCGYNIDEAWKNPLDNNKDSGEVDISIVMTHMMLMAEELGLATCWIGYMNPETIRKNLEIPENIKIVGVFSLGYHREDDVPAKLHTIRRSNEDLVKFL